MRPPQWPRNVAGDSTDNKRRCEENKLGCDGQWTSEDVDAIRPGGGCERTGLREIRCTGPDKMQNGDGKWLASKCKEEMLMSAVTGGKQGGKGESTQLLFFA